MKRNPLHAICPYFAMFPEAFAEEQIAFHTKANDLVLDPFSGRGTTVFQSLLMNRQAAGADINPVAYCVSGAKAEIPDLDVVLATINQLEEEYLATDLATIEAVRLELPKFFRRAFYHATLRELLYLRGALDWQNNATHRFVAALSIGSLHGEVNNAKSYFSNQMTRTISTKPDYSLRFWKQHDLYPTRRRVFPMLRQKAQHRLSGEIPARRGRIVLTDVRNTAAQLPDLDGSVRLVLTSPPYLNVTRYEEDQWLRLWFLGNAPRPTYSQISRDDRHENTDAYWTFLSDAWRGVAPLMKKGSRLVCRLGAKGIGLDELTEGFLMSVRSVFPRAQFMAPPVVSDIRRRQTDHFRPGSRGCLYEADYTVSLKVGQPRPA